MTMAEELLHQGQNEMAAEAFKKVIAIDKRVGVADREGLIYKYNRLGIALRRQKRFQEAITWYSEALNLAPENPGLHYNIGVACTYSGDYKRAIKEFDTALKLDPTLEEAKVEREKLISVTKERATST